MHGISQDFRLKAKLDYECTNLAKIIAPALLKKAVTQLKLLTSTLEVRKNNWLFEILEMIHSFSRSPVYQIAAVLSTKLIASVKE